MGVKYMHRLWQFLHAMTFAIALVCVLHLHLGCVRLGCVIRGNVRKGGLQLAIPQRLVLGVASQLLALEQPLHAVTHGWLAMS
jgi:hypothetical protein